MPDIYDQPAVRPAGSVENAPGSREIRYSAVRHEFQGDNQIVARAIAQCTECLDHDVQRQLLQQPRVELVSDDGDGMVPQL